MSIQAQLNNQAISQFQSVAALINRLDDEDRHHDADRVEAITLKEINSFMTPLASMSQSEKDAEEAKLIEIFKFKSII